MAFLVSSCSVTPTSNGQETNQSASDIITSLQSNANLSTFYNTLVDSNIIENSALTVNAATIFAPMMMRLINSQQNSWSQNGINI